MRYLPALLILLLALLCIGVWTSVIVQRGDVLYVAFLDVGQGDAIYVEAPNGQQVLIDAGRGSSITRALGEVMPFWDRSIDIVLATHPDADHIGGMPDVLRRFAVDRYIESNIESDNSIDDEVRILVQEKNIEHVYAMRGQIIQLDESVILEILYPDRDVSDESDINDASVVVRLVHGESEFLFTGDASKSVEQYLVWFDSSSVEADVLKVGHHGSRTSTDDSFVSFVNPTYAIISAGDDNRYGHPHQEVIETLQRFDTTILTTYEEGTIVFESDGERVYQR